VVTVVRRLPVLALTGLVRFYQLAISPWTAPSCKYYPSCSQYALVALQRHGALRGTWLAVRRLGRCHPWAAGGVDDVPPVGQWRTPSSSPARDGHHHADHEPTMGHREQEPA
jgi:putative membrane protein insertion efficiency factor